MTVLMVLLLLVIGWGMAEFGILLITVVSAVLVAVHTLDDAEASFASACTLT